MNFNESITLDTYSDNANKQFDEMQARLSKTDGGFQNRMEGHTTSDLIGSFIGTLAWLAAFIVCAIMIRKMVSGVILAFAMITVLGLVIFMLIDNSMNFTYYGNIDNYRNSVTRLQNRVSVGKNSIKSNHSAFVGAKENGWNYLLNAAYSIPEEAASIEATMANIETLKTGFINNAKIVFYYAASVMITVAGCVALFPVGSKIITGISGETLSADIIRTLNTIALLLVVVAEVFLARFVWGKTDCTVTNLTLFAVAIGPIAYMALIAVATFIVMLAIMVMYIVIALVALAVGVAFLSGFFSGG